MLRSAATLSRPGGHSNPGWCSLHCRKPVLRYRPCLWLSAAGGSSAAPPTCSSTPPAGGTAVNNVLAEAGLENRPMAVVGIQAASHMFHQKRAVQEQQEAMSQLQGQLSKAGLSPQQQAMALLMCSGAMQSTDAASPILTQSLSDGNSEVGKAAAAEWGAAAGDNPLLGCSSSTAAIRLAVVMQQHVRPGEDPIVSKGVVDRNLHKKYQKWLEQLGPQQVWDFAQEAIHLHQHGNERRADNGKKRTCNGILIKLLKKQSGEHEKQQLPSLWPGGAPPAQLRPYQRACVDRIVGSDSNFLVAAPTGSGKTAIAADVARQLVNSNPAAKVVMVVPTLALCGQQSTALSQYCGCPVGDYNGNNPLTAEEWPQALENHSMMVFTAQVLLNVLQKQPAALSQVDLLVLDEAHHARGGSPYTGIMNIHNQLATDGAQLPRVLGLTASPGAADTQEETAKDIQQLLNMFQADLQVVEEEVLAEQQYIGIPETKVVHVATRPADREGWFSLLAALLAALEAINTAATVAGAAAGTEAQRLQELYCDLIIATQGLGRQTGQDGALDMALLLEQTSTDKQTLMNEVETAVGTMLAVVAEYNTPQELGAAGSAAPLPLEVARCVMLCQVGGHGGCGPLHA